MIEKASLILYNANVITLYPGKPRAQLVAVHGDQIVAVGGEDLLAQLQGPGTKLMNCEKRTLVPGFNDAHCHVLAFARSLLAVDCTPYSVKSIEDIKASVRQRAADKPPGTWIKGTGYNEFYLAERRHPTRHDLDEAAPRHQVILNHRSGHACVLNSLGLQAVGITNETPEPQGALIDRELDIGQPSGLLFEMNHLVDRAMPSLPTEELDKATGLADDHYLSLGIVSLQDATTDNDFARWQTFRKLKENGKLSGRVTMMASAYSLEQFIERGMGCHFGDEGLRLGAMKLLLTESTGRLFPSQEELNERVFQAHEAGFQVALHAVEETSVEAAVTALENTLTHLHRPGHRHRIEHCSECTPSPLDRLQALKAMIVTQPSFLYYSGERYLSQVPSSQQPWLYRIGSFWKAGLITAAGSDSPVVPCSPLIGIYAAVTRKAQSGEVLLLSEHISPLQAMSMYTNNAAYASFDEKTKGSITPGRLADLVLLSADPTSVPVEEIKDIEVERTIIGGRVVWERE